MKTISLKTAPTVLVAIGLAAIHVTAAAHEGNEEHPHREHHWQDSGLSTAGFVLDCEYRALVDKEGRDTMFYPDEVTTSNLWFYTDSYTQTIMADTRNRLVIPGGGQQGGAPHTVRKIEQRC